MPRTPSYDSALGCDEAQQLDRRLFLTGGAATLALWELMPRAAAATGQDPRLLTIILRGGVDGLSVAAPVGDPAYAGLRGPIALTQSGPNAGLPLDQMFVLNPAMTFLHSLYLKKQALIVHATSSPYRGRSHFDGQDVLESGFGGVSRAETGWLNRALTRLPHLGSTAALSTSQGLGVGAVVPLVMRGPAPVLTWVPKSIGMPLRDSTVARLADLYAHTDPGLAKAFAEGLEISKLSGGEAPPSTSAAIIANRRFRGFIETAEAAAKILASDSGPRIGALSYEGWDTHANEGAASGLLATQLGGLDIALKAFAEGMGPVWAKTVVLVVTEFGRTAHVNGTNGTDHGTGTCALLLGGRINGGRVITDWPGLAPKSLYEARDLAPTTDLRSVMKGVLADHLAIPSGALANSVFPDSRTVLPMQGLLA